MQQCASLRGALCAPPSRSPCAPLRRRGTRSAPGACASGRRVGHVERKTKETSVSVTLDLDGTGVCHAASGIPFLDHMLDVRALKAAGGLRIARA
jgi:hypothetical protein